MLALLGLTGLGSIHAMNATKSVLTGTMNAIAALCFVIAGKVWWVQTLVMLAAAVTGGYVGAAVARRMNPLHVRIVILLISFMVTFAFFWRHFAA
jgi:uncharacterized protein